MNWESVRKSKWSRAGLYILLFILLVILMDKVVMPYYVRLGDETELPDVEELPLAEAKNKLQAEGFTVIVADSVYNANSEIGTVVEQMPLPYSTVKRGRNVYLTVSIGEKPIIMPNLFYKSPREAELILKSNGLELASTFYEYNDISLEGVVIAQSYPQGQVVKAGTKISITVSLGPFPKQKVVPNLVGKSLDAARKQMQLLGVKDISVNYEERENILPETVLAQSVKEGTPISEDTQLELTVSAIMPVEEP